MQKLIDENFVDLEESQNYSPTIGDFVQFAKQYKDDDTCTITFHGYVVSPNRDDYRVSAEGLVMSYDYYNVPIHAISNFCESFHYADEFNWNYTPDNPYLRVWWD